MRRRRGQGGGPQKKAKPGPCSAEVWENEEENEPEMEDEAEEKDTLSQREAAGESEDEERGVSVEAEGEEGRESVGIRAPQKVSKEEREEHERTHTPYRAWCPYCVKGRGRNTPHAKNRDNKEEAESKVPRVSMDYFFMSQKDEKQARIQSL